MMSRAMSMGTLQKTKQVADEIGTPASLLLRQHRHDDDVLLHRCQPHHLAAVASSQRKPKTGNEFLPASRACKPSFVVAVLVRTTRSWVRTAHLTHCASAGASLEYLRGACSYCRVVRREEYRFRVAREILLTEQGYFLNLQLLQEVPRPRHVHHQPTNQPTNQPSR